MRRNKKCKKKNIQWKKKEEIIRINFLLLNFQVKRKKMRMKKWEQNKRKKEDQDGKKGRKESREGERE